MNTTIIIRDRGQITIPKEIRKKVPWLKTGAVVVLYVGNNEIKIKPYKSAANIR